MSDQARRRTIVYVDALNLYYGALRGGPYKWLNVERFFRLLRNADDIQKIHYFTALTAGPSGVRQKSYLQALSTLPLVNVVLGRFKTKTVKCLVGSCAQADDDRFFQMPEEKRTDVNIAVHMLEDAYDDLANTLVLVSGDSDLVPAVNAVRFRFPEKQIIVYVPATNTIRGAATELRTSAHKHRTLPLELLPKSQFPAVVPDGRGGTISKPTGW
jgi:uncharacterized LabA/DUF88 family protein